MKNLLATAVIFSFVTEIAHAQSLQWVDARQLKSEISKAKRSGKFPTSLKCRKDPASKVTSRVQIKVTWKPNTKQKDWALYAYKGQLDFRPGNISEQKKWRRLVRQTIKLGRGGTLFRCSLFHKR